VLFKKSPMSPALVVATSQEFRTKLGSITSKDLLASSLPLSIAPYFRNQGSKQLPLNGKQLNSTSQMLAPCYSGPGKTTTLKPFMIPLRD